MNLSVFFSGDRTYVTITESSPKGLRLKYVNSTNLPVNFHKPAAKASVQGALELDAMLAGFGEDIDGVSVTLPSETVLVSQFPGKPGISPDDMRQLVSFEIRQAYPQFNYEDFNSHIVPLEPNLKGQSMMMAVIIAKQDFESCKKLLGLIPIELSKVSISQMNAHSAFLYNYPERAGQTVALLGFQNNFIDFSVIKNKKPAYYNLAALPSPDKIGEVFETEINKITSEYVEKVDSAFFFGEGLSKDVLMAAWETSMLLGFESSRMNAFRMLSSDLEKREREYCARTAHIFPPCIGGAMPAYHEWYKLY